MCQVGVGKTCVTACEVSSEKRLTSKPGCLADPGMSLAGARLLARRCPAWRRREPGQAAFVWNGRKRGPILPPWVGWREGESLTAETGGIEYRCGCAGGLTRSSGEVSAGAVGMERRGQVIRGMFV